MHFVQNIHYLSSAFRGGLDVRQRNMLRGIFRLQHRFMQYHDIAATVSAPVKRVSSFFKLLRRRYRQQLVDRSLALHVPDTKVSPGDLLRTIMQEIPYVDPPELTLGGFGINRYVLLMFDSARSRSKAYSHIEEVCACNEGWRMITKLLSARLDSSSSAEGESLSDTDMESEQPNDPYAF